MIFLFITSLYLLFISIITGHVVSKKLGFSPTLIEKALLGIALSNTVFSIVSLFLPIKPYISLLYLIVCFVFFILEYKNILRFNVTEFKPKNLFFLTFPVIVIFGFINSLYPPTVHDSGLYHIQAIEWIENYSAVPGLGNFHGRFGFNPNIFTLFAATSFEGIVKQDVYSVNFVIYCLISIWLLKGIYKFIRLKYYTIGFIFIIALILILNSSGILSSPTPDFACYFIPFFILLRFIEIKILKNSNYISDYYTIIALSIYIVTVKLAAIPVLLIIPLIFYQNWKFLSKKNLYVTILLILIISVPWLIRNVILTGWIIYPFQGIDIFSFDWKVPKPDVIKMSETITAWARKPGSNFMEAAHMNISQWFPIWWSQRNQFESIIFVMICLTPLLVTNVIFVRKLKGIMKSYQPVYFIAFLGFLFWFLVAPDWRYGLTFIALPLLFSLLFFQLEFNLNSKYLLSIISIMIIAYCIYLNLPSIKYLSKNFRKVIYVTPKIDRMSKTKKGEIVGFQTYMIDGKLEVKYPIDDYRCFDEELPCSSYLMEKIHLRGDELGSGFYKK